MVKPLALLTRAVLNWSDISTFGHKGQETFKQGTPLVWWKSHCGKADLLIFWKKDILLSDIIRLPSCRVTFKQYLTCRTQTWSLVERGWKQTLNKLISKIIFNSFHIIWEVKPNWISDIKQWHVLIKWSHLNDFTVLFGALPCWAF